jgi:hypothetical protein
MRWGTGGEGEGGEGRERVEGKEEGEGEAHTWSGLLNINNVAAFR